ncbi:hypothetical protein BGZ60DRAFT_433993 [Tricladium varicosporioides]|nr:hypothetical protein BGZ60DRAFT_433993 [Hymenoscyphus varicosporioides]
MQLKFLLSLSLSLSTLTLSAVLPVPYQSKARSIDKGQTEDNFDGYNIRDTSLLPNLHQLRDVDEEQIEDGRGGYNIRSTPLTPRTLTYIDINEGQQAQQDDGRGVYGTASRDIDTEEVEAGRGGYNSRLSIATTETTEEGQEEDGRGGYNIRFATRDHRFSKSDGKYKGVRAISVELNLEMSLRVGRFTGVTVWALAGDEVKENRSVEMIA